MRLATQNRRSLLSLSLLGILCLLVTTQGEAADTAAAAKTPLASCPVAGGVDATLAANDSRAAAQQETPSSSTRRVNWRSMLPAVTLPSRF